MRTGSDINGTVDVAITKATDDILIYANTAKDGSGTDYVPVVDTNGYLQVDVITAPTTTVQATNLDIRDLANATDSVAIYGSDDGGTTKRIIKTDAGGAIQVDLEVDDVNIKNAAGDTITGVSGTYDTIDTSLTDGTTRAAIDASGALSVFSKITVIAHGVKTVTTAGTDVALATSTACKRVVIQAQTDNTGLIAVGGSGVDATEATGTGIILYPGDSFELDIDNLADVYIDSTVNGEGVRFTYFN